MTELHEVCIYLFGFTTYEPGRGSETKSVSRCPRRGFFAIFILGGLTGLMLASVPLDLQIHDTFFVVAHLHYVLIGGSVFPLFGAFYYWFPKWTGRMLSERAGHWK